MDGSASFSHARTLCRDRYSMAMLAPPTNGSRYSPVMPIRSRRSTISFRRRCLPPMYLNSDTGSPFVSELVKERPAGEPGGSESERVGRLGRNEGTVEGNDVPRLHAELAEEGDQVLRVAGDAVLRRQLPSDHQGSGEFHLPQDFLLLRGHVLVLGLDVLRAG